MERELERRLVARLKAGDASAFDAIYDAYRAPLFSFLARLSRRRDVAEDLAHETWLRLVTHAHRLDDDSSVAAWLFTVARNLHASWCRHRAVDEGRTQDAPAYWHPLPPGGSPFELAARNETERRLERALAHLATGDRELLLMIAVGGLSHGEAAEALALGTAALRKRLQRARERLEAAMEAEGALGRLKVG